MTRKRFVAAVLAIAIAALGAFPVLAAETQSLTVTAFVENQVCLNGDTVEVTLSATADSSSQPVRFRWDFTNNGSFDTPFGSNPTVVTTYPDEINVTARVVARNSEGDRARDTVQFATLRCTN